MTAMTQPVDRNKGKVEAEHVHKGWPCGAALRLRRNARHYLGGRAPVPSLPFPGRPATFMEEWIFSSKMLHVHTI